MADDVEDGARCRHPASAHGLLAVYGLADDVGVAGVLGGLSEDVGEDAPRAPGRARLEPGSRGQRLSRVEVGAEYELVGGGGHLVVPLQQTGEALAVQHPEAIDVLLHLGWRVPPVDARPV